MSDLRLFPRLHTELQVEITNQRGETLSSRVRNLSPGGLMIDGDLTVKELIAIGVDQDPLARPIEVNICCQLNSDPVPFRSRCRLVFVRRLSQLEFNFGFRFVDVSAEMAERLENFVSNKSPSVTSSAPVLENK